MNWRFWRKKTQFNEEEQPKNQKTRSAQQGQAGEQKPPKKRSGWIVWPWRLIKYSFLLVLLIVIAALAALGWLTQSGSGQQWLTAKANGLLAPAEGKPGYKITLLNGSIPADFTLGIEAYDAKGLWLSAPDIRFVWLWRELPKTLHIQCLTVNGVDMARLPEFPLAPPEPEEQPSPPLTLQDVQKLLADAASFLQQPHWYLPDVLIDSIAANDVRLPETLLPSEGPQRLQADLTAELSFLAGKTAAKASLTAKNALAEHLDLPQVRLHGLGAGISLRLDPVANGLEAALNLGAHVDQPVLEIDALPPDFLGKRPEFSLAINALANTVNPAAEISIDGPALQAGHAHISGSGSWQSDASWTEGKIAGPLNYKLNAELLPLADGADSPLTALRQPARVLLALSGDLPTISAKLSAACDKIRYEDHAIDSTDINLAANHIELPLNDSQLRSLEEENELPFTASTVVDGRKVNISTDLFFQALAKNAAGDTAGWRAGLRKLVINALGLIGSGQMAVLLPDGQKPVLDGNLALEVKDWKEINSFLPGKTLSGDVRVNALLRSTAPGTLQDPAATLPHISLSAAAPLQQSVHARVEIPHLAFKDGASTVDLQSLNLDAQARNVLANPDLNVQLQFKKLNAAGMALGGNAQVHGPLSGPIQAAVNTSGSVEAKIAAQWQPGKAQIGTLDVMANIAPFINNGGKPFMAGIKSGHGAEITYGDHGIQAKNVDWRIIPQGRLTADGGVSPEKLDFRLNLAGLELKPWQALIPQIPAGAVSLKANLSGSPRRPSGDFRLDLKNIAIPKNPLGPLSLALNGAVQHASAGSQLKMDLQLDPNTIKKLGGSTAQVSAAIPLKFDQSGVPGPNMNGPLSAKVRWDGALGPIWELLPLADQRLNGRVAIDMDAQGTMAKPRLNGKATVTNGRYENLMAGVLLTDINAAVALDGAGAPGQGTMAGLPGRIKVNASLGDGRGGSVTATGGGSLSGNGLDIKAKINKLKPLRRRDVHVELSGHIDVTGSATTPMIAGEVIVDKGEVLLNNIVIPGSVTVLEISDPEIIRSEAKKRKEDAAKAAKMAKNAKPMPAPANPGQLNVRITMPPRFTVEGRGLASVWKASLLVTGQLTDPKISGNISCARGNFDFLGRNFALSKGIVFFGGGSPANPLVDVDLTYETQDLTAHILVTGPANKVKLEMTSDPSLPRDEILSRVLFGRSVNDLSRMEMLQLAGAVAQLAGFGGGSGPLGMAKKALGVDVLRLGTSDTGATGDNDAGGTNIEMGKYINDFIYMGVQQGFKPDSTAFIIDIEVTPRTSFELRTEQSNTWGGIKWKMNY